VVGMKVKFLGNIDTLAFEKNKIYDVISVEKGWYRVMTELDEDYLFPPHLFEIIETNSTRTL
jgi:tRNA A22 N-methylase